MRFASIQLQQNSTAVGAPPRPGGGSFQLSPRPSRLRGPLRGGGEGGKGMKGRRREREKKGKDGGTGQGGKRKEKKLEQGHGLAKAGPDDKTKFGLAESIAVNSV